MKNNIKLVASKYNLIEILKVETKFENNDMLVEKFTSKEINNNFSLIAYKQKYYCTFSVKSDFEGLYIVPSGHDCMVVGFITTYAVGAYQH